MAVSLNSRTFQNAHDLAVFCQGMANSVTTVISITYDSSSGIFTLFWV